MQPHAARARWIGLAQNLLLAACSTLMCIASLEGLARLTGQQTCAQPAEQTEDSGEKVRFHPLRLYELVPGSTFTFEREAALRHGLSPDYLDTWERISYRINSLGLRGAEPKLAKTDGSFRILVLGDSVAFGWGVEEGDTFSSQLQQHLNRTSSGQRFEVWNAGVPGYATWQELEYLIETGWSFQPDLVLVAFLFNDVDGNNEASQDSPFGAGTWGKSFTLWARKSALVCFLRNTALGLRVKYLQPCQGPNCWGDTETALDGLVVQADTLGSSLVVAAFPMRLQIEPDAEPGYYDRALGENADQSYQGIISRLCRERAIGFLDLLPAFQQAYSTESITLFLDADHPNTQGHHVAAEAAHQFLLELLSTTAAQPRSTKERTGVHG
jgi:lysophospholipase L1-like esterase